MCVQDPTRHRSGTHICLLRTCLHQVSPLDPRRASCLTLYGGGRILLQLLYGAAWTATEAPAVLAWYCLFVLFMALNGLTEAYVHALASTRHALYPLPV